MSELSSAQLTEQINLLLNGQEIEPDGIYDFSFRRVPDAKIPYFRGLQSQLTVNPDDKNRLQAWYGDKLGHCEQVVLQSDFNESKYYACFKNLAVDCLSKKLSNTSYTLDPNSYGLAYLKLTELVTLNLLTPVKAGTRFQIVAENLYKNTTLRFADTLKIKWTSGTEPVFPSDAGKVYVITLTFNGTNWIGGQDGLGTSTGKETVNISANLNASVMSLGYCLPAGASSAGEYADRYALFSGIASFSDDDLINIAQVATSLPKIEALLERYETLLNKVQEETQNG